MEKVKDVSDVIDYKNLKFKYFNSYCPVKKDKQKEINEKNRDETEKLLDDFIKEEPLFCQIEIVEVKNEIIKEKNRNKFYYIESKTKPRISTKLQNTYGRKGYQIELDEGNPEFIKDMNYAKFKLKKK